ncbi:metal-dependent protein hydrolase [Alkaliphilus metalliredigens QYMF]|uniref:Metal-dependent protein hydrolase n=1 Tax=Alkaliphilus metalliredigens (strain QYMF) TaxID=293826 RepID=A6TKH3_ALKMQ|nr:MYG1 family protein [Alkaliphilus metalliredigens]ABR46691.1 metal-dependent protein hydrolase [Alkaliphilus metalliredigens QYMF]
MEKPYKRVGTHHGRFHADEVMATAILMELFEIEVTRTRDPKILSKLDIVYDVGGGVFDHHGIEKVYRDDGIPFAACGLIWNEFGRKVISMKESSLVESEIELVFESVDRALMKGIDAIDNGVRIGEQIVDLMDISSIVSMFNPPWDLEKSEKECFDRAVAVASSVLNNTIDHKLAVLRTRIPVSKAYKRRENPKILVLEKSCPWQKVLSEIDERNEVLFVVYPDKDNYAIQTVRGEDGEDKKYLPKSWVGKEEKELAEVTGVADAVFCHTGRFIAVARRLESIVKMAELAINEEDKP